MDGLLKQATEDIRVLSEEVQTKSAALGKEKSENEAAAGIIERMKIDFELKLEEREEKLTKIFMRNQLNSIYLATVSLATVSLPALLTASLLVGLPILCIVGAKIAQVLNWSKNQLI